ncbi:PREDICTED: ubiquitin carboxyl-terminal hydrolase 47-like [Amphimedon queenslandica]|uniref:Ubiquitin carboxyl-terminal hydrolase 47 C-terminal domain-containing protein n=1 Tax=Amphimedon queenslandica TaxID=400682 RepID=A0A1X7T053_AMPQE|nr:PREDICTED: ubiquitin carboxyl-terminal hydrolase 47-like [Amphimedon queenslandica]|eukprot:XP_019862080.1 PREDICTED: ubiquitin carboxyl-terminal hydrolase 47-like [Amphimedon queenslandica]
MVDLLTGEVGPAEPVRGEEGWTVEELKEHIGEEFNINPSCMRVAMRGQEHYQLGTSVHDISDAKSTLEKLHTQLLFISSDLKDYQKEFKDSLMYRYVDFHVNSITLNITIPPGPEATPTKTNLNVTEGGTIMKTISINEENKGKERRIQVQVSSSITLAQLKEELVSLIGVPPTGFIVYGIGSYGDYEMVELDQTLKYIGSGSELIVRLGRAILQEGEKRIKLYLLQVNNTEFCSFMMESIVTKDTTVGEFKKQIIEEAKVQGIDCVLELDKMRLRGKKGVSPSTVYLDDEVINANKDILYVESLKGPEKMKHAAQVQVYVVRWRPSQCSVDPIEEIILDNRYDPKDFIGKLSELSGVPAEYIYYTEGLLFPVGISCLDIENKFNWYSISSVKRSSLGLYDDGRVLYYKDKRETMKELTDKEIRNT